MKTTISDPWLGDRALPTTCLELIRDQHKLLCAMRDDGRALTQELLDDIAAYASILDAPDPELRAKEYQDARIYDGTQRPRHVARKKGWI